VLKLIAGLYHAQAQAIRIDGCYIRQFDPAELRQAVAYVPQLRFDSTNAMVELERKRSRSVNNNADFDRVISGYEALKAEQLAIAEAQRQAHSSQSDVIEKQIQQQCSKQ